ncbi:MAG TPA: 50S ribosomal protein L23 [Bacteroidetes bacterium]|nr:50S ribosomal protein L23 [bacterium BMS3Bbin04]HDO66156.1 50S ribosomal protein L23 [Bacteroidota bacterium]HEX05281.1 50S ribosomal protein L23 [Bacteroidota bacterium]
MDETARLRKLLKRPLQTEKAVLLIEKSNTYVFEIPPDANKIEIRRAVEKLFEVTVKDVRTVKLPGKKKRLGRYEGYRAGKKKAYVTLAEGQSLELYENV